MKGSLEFGQYGGYHHIRGDTYFWKDMIKACVGARWDSYLTKWTIPVTSNIDVLLNAYDEYCEKHMPKYGKCCRFAEYKEDYEFGPLYIFCWKHGKRACGSRGFGYTGD